MTHRIEVSISIPRGWRGQHSTIETREQINIWSDLIWEKMLQLIKPQPNLKYPNKSYTDSMGHTLRDLL